jgi:hypothetical protein
MPTLSEIRAEIGPDCRLVLSHIWSLFLTTGIWPSSRLVHSHLGKDFVRRALTKTNGSVVSEKFSNGSKHYELIRPGPLLTQDGLNYVSLLLKYLDYLRVTYQHAPEKQTVSNEEIEKALHLTVEESRTLGQLISVTQLFSNNASCGKESWSVGVLAESEDFPDGPLDKVLEDFVLRSYDTSYPVWYKDQIAKLSEHRLYHTRAASTRFPLRAFERLPSC